MPFLGDAKLCGARCVGESQFDVVERVEAVFGRDMGRNWGHFSSANNFHHHRAFRGMQVADENIFQSVCGEKIMRYNFLRLISTPSLSQVSRCFGI